MNFGGSLCVAEDVKVLLMFICIKASAAPDVNCDKNPQNICFRCTQCPISGYLHFFHPTIDDLTHMDIIETMCCNLYSFAQ